jgi:hypothetical protein
MKQRIRSVKIPFASAVTVALRLGECARRVVGDRTAVADQTADHLVIRDAASGRLVAALHPWALRSDPGNVGEDPQPRRCALQVVIEELLHADLEVVLVLSPSSCGAVHRS